MSDISNLLIKDSYDYVIQVDPITRQVLRIGGSIPTNPIFISGLTINSSFQFSNGTEQNGYFLKCDAQGNASWFPVVVSGGTYALNSVNISGYTLIFTDTLGNVINITLPQTSGSTGTSGTSGTSGSSGTSGTSGTGFNTVQNPALTRLLTSDGTTNGAIAQSGLTFSGRTLTLNNGIITGVDGVNFNTNPTVSPTGGTLYFDYAENALSYKPLTNNNDVTVNIGQESLIRVYNSTGTQINNGQAVHVSGSTSGTPTVILANASYIGGGATIEIGASQVAGVATHNIPSGEYGFITNFGVVRGMNTSGFTSGDELYLSDTINGGITNDPQSISVFSRVCVIGWCLTSDPVDGKILVSISNENPVQSLTQKEINTLLGNVVSTGIYDFTGLTINSPTSFNVPPVKV